MKTNMKTKKLKRKKWFHRIIDEENCVVLNQFHVKSGDFKSVYKYTFKCFFFDFTKKNCN